VAPLILATVLAQPLETALSQSLLISRGSMSIFFTRPIAVCFMLLAFASIARGLWTQFKTGAPEALDDSDD
jgi:putative tricarboxylic transport membrane protein